MSLGTHENGPASHDNRNQAVASLALAVLGGATSIWTILARGWVPFDEGTIAQAAERVLSGALPHRDFTDPYTGGLAFWHSLAMRVFGVTLMAPRFALFIAFVLWLPAVWWLARRYCGLRSAVVLTVIAAWWSLPIYPAAMPTWYLLFFGTWIVVALERWQASKPDGHVRWLVLVGVLCGAAVLVKQTGLYLVAASLLGVLYCDQEDVRAQAGEGMPARGTDPVVLILLAVLGMLVFKLTWGRIGSGEMLNEILPLDGLLAIAMLREWRLTGQRAKRWRVLFRYVGIVVVAMAAPVAVFLVPYALSGSLGALYADTIGEGVRRISALHVAMRPALTLVVAVWPVYALLAFEALMPGRRAVRALALAIGVALVWSSFRSMAGYQRLWFFGTSLLPLGIGAVLVAGYRAWRAHWSIDPVLLVLAGVTAFQALNQFPYAQPNYFAYVAPLAILTAFAAAAHFKSLSRGNTAMLILAAFSGVVLRLGSVHSVGYYPKWWDYSHRLAVTRGGLLVTEYDSARYTHLLDLVARHRANGTVYAGPELPEVYFLSGQESPGRDSYSLFPAPVRDSAEVSRLFNLKAASVIVIKTHPMFNPPIPADVYQWLAIRYPRSETIDTLEVRWRPTP